MAGLYVVGGFLLLNFLVAFKDSDLMIRIRKSFTFLIILLNCKCFCLVLNEFPMNRV